MPIMDHFSVAVFPWGRKPPTMTEVVEAAQYAEKLGFYSVNVPLMNAIPDAGPFARFGNKSILDARVLLPAIIAATSKIRIAVDSIPLPYLPPFDWAKYFASLDVISNGRVIVGMCLGMVDEAFHAVGADRRKRGAIADEQLEIITRLWTEDEVTYDGQFYKLNGVSMEPKPIQKPYPPIWWGGRSVSIPRAARYCEYINPPWPTFDELSDVYLPRLGEAPIGKWGQRAKVSAWIYSTVTEGREMSDSQIEEYFSGLMDLEYAVDTTSVTVAGSPEQSAERISNYLDAGLDHFVFDFVRHGVEPHDTLMRQMDLMANKVAPLL